MSVTVQIHSFIPSFKGDDFNFQSELKHRRGSLSGEQEEKPRSHLHRSRAPVLTVLIGCGRRAGEVWIDPEAISGRQRERGDVTHTHTMTGPYIFIQG